MPKRQISIQIDEEIAKELDEISNRTGINVSKQIEIRLIGYRVIYTGGETK